MTDYVFTATQKADCAARELRLRNGVYPKWISDGRITAQKAAYEIALMAAIEADYRKLAEKDRLL